MVIVIGGGGRPPEYVQVPYALIERIRKVSALLGSLVIVLSVGVGIAALLWAFALPTAEIPLTYILVALVFLQSLFGLFSGIIAVAGRSCVKTGYLERVGGKSLFQMNVVFLIFAAILTVFSWLLTALMASMVDSGFTLEILAFLVLTSVPALLTILSVVGASRLLRVSPSVPPGQYGGW